MLPLLNEMIKKENNNGFLGKIGQKSQVRSIDNWTVGGSPRWHGWAAVQTIRGSLITPVLLFSSICLVEIYSVYLSISHSPMCLLLVLNTSALAEGKVSL